MIVNGLHRGEGEEDHRLPGTHARQGLGEDGTQTIKKKTLYWVVVQ
jgi:hypothetical protein